MLITTSAASQEHVFIRLNQLGFGPSDLKSAVVFSSEPLPEEFRLVKPHTGAVVFRGRLNPIAGSWGQFNRHADLDFFPNALLKKMVRGGLIDGPVYRKVFQSLRGVSIKEPDPFAVFQDDRAVYHDDINDYSTNEPTMDGTASAILLICVIRG